MLIRLPRPVQWGIITVLLVLGFIIASLLPAPTTLENELNHAAENVVNKAVEVHNTGTGEGDNPEASNGPTVKSVLSASMIIFKNNLRALTVLSVPVMAQTFLPVFVYVNGQVLATLSYNYLNTSPLHTASILVKMPHTWLEFLAYGIVFTESTRLTYNLYINRMRISKTYLVNRLKPYLFYVLLAVVILFYAAVVEVISIIR